jgi:hypothetical protein
MAIELQNFGDTRLLVAGGGLELVQLVPGRVQVQLAAGVGVPGGPNLSIQFNDGGAFNGSEFFTLDLLASALRFSLISAFFVLGQEGDTATIQGADATTGGVAGASLVVTSGDSAGVAGPDLVLRAGSGTSSGNVQLRTGPTTRLFLRGNASASTGVRFTGYGAGTLQTDASGNVTAVSDDRLKENVTSFKRGLAELVNIAPILFGWRADTGLDQSKKNYVGFSAQNVQAAMPEAVHAGDDGFLGVSDRALIAALINAVVELNARLIALEP